MKKWNYMLLLAVSAVFLSCATTTKDKSAPDFVKIENGQFIRAGKPYYYVGTNFWYGAILGSQGQGGDRERLCQELDSMKSIGIDNLRILVGSDGKRGVPAKVEPTLQIAPGVYNDTIFDGLDYLLAEMGKRKMLAVLYLNNSWEWSGGYGQYLQWAGYGNPPAPATDGYQAYMEYVGQFVQSDSAKALYANYVKDVITRTNRYTQIKYTDDPTIMSWQIGNEPRAFADKNKVAFARWMSEAAALIKSLDKNHLVSTGSEGKWGCEMDMSLFEQIHADANVDYLNIHIWPYNWGWARKDSLQENLDRAKQFSKAYIDEHLAIAKKYQKPLVLEEFGYPRDGFLFAKGTPVTARNAYYTYIFDLIAQHATSNSLFAGCNFWGWGGQATPSAMHEYWVPGDDYTGDPAQEQQGLNSVFSSDDSTVNLVRKVNQRLSAEYLSE